MWPSDNKCITKKKTLFNPSTWISKNQLIHQLRKRWRWKNKIVTNYHMILMSVLRQYFNKKVAPGEIFWLIRWYYMYVYAFSIYKIEHSRISDIECKNTSYITWTLFDLKVNNFRLNRSNPKCPLEKRGQHRRAKTALRYWCGFLFFYF